MKVTELKNGQFEVTHENLKLVQTVINGQRFNECYVIYEWGEESVSTGNPIFKELFTALYDYKSRS